MKVITSISAHDITNKILSSDSNYIVNVVVPPKFGNSNVSTREVFIALFVLRFNQEKTTFLSQIQEFGTHATVVCKIHWEFSAFYRKSWFEVKV